MKRSVLLIQAALCSLPLAGLAFLAGFYAAALLLMILGVLSTLAFFALLFGYMGWASWQQAVRTQAAINELRDFHLWPSERLLSFLENLLRHGLENWEQNQRHRIEQHLPPQETMVLLRVLDEFMSDNARDFPIILRFLEAALMPGSTLECSLRFDGGKPVRYRSLKKAFARECGRLDRRWESRVRAAYRRIQSEGAPA